MHIVKNPVFLTVILLSSLEQIAHFSVQPILSLFVSDLHGKTNVALYSGIAFSAAGLGNFMMTKRWGKISDKYGYTKILIILLLAAGLIYLPGAAVTQFWQLVIIRFVLGVLIGGVVPTRIAYIRQEAPIAMQGEVLGYNTSFRFFGNIIGPMLGGFISGTFGYSAVFISTSALLIISGLILFAAVHYQPKFLKHTA